MFILSTTTAVSRKQRGLMLLALLAALMIPVLAGAPSADAATPRKAPPKASNVFHGPLSKAEKQQLATQKARLVRTLSRTLGRNDVTAKDSASFFCDPYVTHSWGYSLFCHVVVLDVFGYNDYYANYYWTGSRWAFWY